MRTRASTRHTRLLAPRASENRIETAGFAFDDDEDAFCDSYLVAGRDGDIPGLQEYLQELWAD